MNAQLMFQKSLLLLDGGRLAEGEDCLRNTISQAEQENSHKDLVPALVCLGDLLHELNRDAEAKALLERALSIEHDPGLDDILDYELNRARELLQQIKS